MIKRLRKPSKKYNLLFQKHVVILQSKAISNKTRNKSPPLAERLTKACPDGKNKSGTTIAIVWSVPGGGKVFEFRFFFKSIRIGIIYLRRRGQPWGHFFAESRFIARKKTENLGDN